MDAGRNSGRPEWFRVGKAHADRAKQFKPFAALRGYDEMIDSVIGRSQSGLAASAGEDDAVERVIYGICSLGDGDVP